VAGGPPDPPDQNGGALRGGLGTRVNGYVGAARVGTAKRALGILAIAAALAMLQSGCSEIGFPAVHDMPAARADTTLTPDQVKQATDDLVSQREHLSTEVQANGQPAQPANGPSAQQKKPAAPLQPVAVQNPVPGDTQPAGAYAKP
jgi:hypothetical protein